MTTIEIILGILFVITMGIFIYEMTKDDKL